jgi:hypothetical protein
MFSLTCACGKVLANQSGLQRHTGRCVLAGRAFRPSRPSHTLEDDISQPHDNNHNNTSDAEYLIDDQLENSVLLDLYGDDNGSSTDLSSSTVSLFPSLDRFDNVPDGASSSDNPSEEPGRDIDIEASSHGTGSTSITVRQSYEEVEGRPAASPLSNPSPRVCRSVV